MKKLGSIQKDTVTICNGLPASTPYQGLIYECGLKPQRYRIMGKRLIYLNKILKMKETRLTRQAYNEQKRLNFKDCWHYQIKNDLKDFKIYLTEKQISNLPIKEWEKLIKPSVVKSIENDLRKDNGSKTSFIRKCCFGIKQYIKHSEAPKLLKLKLNIVDLKANFRGKNENAFCRRC